MKKSSIKKVLKHKNTWLVIIFLFSIFLLFVPYCSGCLEGFFIGWFTNWLAIKGLFHPKKPFLSCIQGVIPKKRKELSFAIGETVSTELLTTDGIKKEINESGVVDKIADNLTSMIYDDRKTIDELLQGLSINRKEFCDNTSKLISSYIILELKKIDYEEILERINWGEIIGKAFGSQIVSSFVPQSFIVEIPSKTSAFIRDYLQKDGNDLITNIVRAKVNDLSVSQISGLTGRFNIERNNVTTGIKKLIYNIINRMLDDKIKFYIKNIVVKKIDEMDINKIEKMINKVSGEELGYLEVVGGIFGALVSIISPWIISTIKNI